jgi:hypothetical protein
MAFRRARAARWHDPAASRDISRQAAVVVFPGQAAAPGSSGANSRCRRRYLRGCAIVFHRAISTSLPSRCQLRVIPKRSGLSYCLSPVLNRAAPRKAVFASRLYTHTHTYMRCVAGLVDGLKCMLQRRWRGLFQNGSRVCSFSSRQKTKVKGIRANLHVPVPFYSPVGRRTDCSPGIGQRPHQLLLTKPGRHLGALERAGAMSHTLDGSIDSASMRAKRTLSAIPRSSG